VSWGTKEKRISAGAEITSFSVVKVLCYYSLGVAGKNHLERDSSILPAFHPNLLTFPDHPLAPQFDFVKK